MKIVGCYQNMTKNFFRLGKKGDKPRPIKVILDSPKSAKEALSKSSELSNLQNSSIYLKPDKTKGEIAEYQRLGKVKADVLKTYPTIQNEQPRVKLEKGILSLDGMEVDRYKSIQTLF